MFHNRYAAAAAQFQQLIRDHPRDPQPHAAYALLLNYQLKQADALTEAMAASSLAPQDGYALTVLTRVQDWNNQLNAAAQTGGVAGEEPAPPPPAAPFLRRGAPPPGGG